jgi:hypothetical protein
MAKDTSKKNARLSFWGFRLLTVSSRVAAFFATRISRFLILLLFVLLSLYISYQQVWRPIVATAPLPPGVTEKSPQLNAGLLEVINAHRVERVETPRAQFNAGSLFKPPLTP